MFFKTHSLFFGIIRKRAYICSVVQRTADIFVLNLRFTTFRAKQNKQLVPKRVCTLCRLSHMVLWLVVSSEVYDDCLHILCPVVKKHIINF